MHNLWGKHFGLVVPMSYLSLALLLPTILSSVAVWHRVLHVKAHAVRRVALLSIDVCRVGYACNILPNAG